MHADPKTMTAWELAYALTEMADRAKHRDAAVLRAAVRRLADDAERTGEPGFIPGHQAPHTWADSYRAAADREAVALRAGRQSDPPFHPMMGAAPAAYRTDPARDVEAGAQ